jgi:diguanylate cyclase (GGDEF)-like protein
MGERAQRRHRGAALTEGLSAPETLALRCAFALLALIVASGAANFIGGVGGATVDAFIRGWGSSVAYILAAAIVLLRAARIPRGRGAWSVLAAGLTLYVAGNVVWAIAYEHMASPSIPSVSDGLWLALYPASYLGLVMLARAQHSTVAAGVWLDGIVAGLGFAAIGAALVFGPVLQSSSGSPAAVITNLAYPVADLLLAALVVGLMAMRDWRLDRCWGLLGAGFMLLCVADSMYLLRVASGAVHADLLLNVLYLSSILLLALAAWQPARDAPAAIPERSLSVLLVPAACVVGAIALLLYDHFVRLGALGLSLAVLTVLAATFRMALTFRDVSALAAMRREATTDHLTSLANRRLFLRRVDEALASANGGAVALLIVDLDQFKTLNDTLGHHAGDLLLAQIGPRVDAVLRESDLLARLGGDEFGVLLPAPCSEATALRVADRVGEALRIPFEVEGLHLPIAASIGIALYPTHSSDARQLLRHADVAMYQAKAARSGRELYARDRDTNSRDNLALAAELPGAIASGGLVVYFQPKTETATGRTAGLEALVRWQHPRHGLLPPAAFVALAEQAGLMRDLTRAVIAGSVAACAHWRAAGHDVDVAVNVSFTDLLDARFPIELAATVALHGIDPGSLILEVTESSIMSEAQRTGDVIARLTELGVRISLDDFGTGYSSLAHLRALPVAEIKVDRSFVSRMTSDATDHAIVRSTIQLAHSLGMSVVAEGVEDESTWTALDDLGCDLIQGYVVSRPMPFHEAEAFLAANRTHVA